MKRWLNFRKENRPSSRCVNASTARSTVPPTMAEISIILSFGKLHSLPGHFGALLINPLGPSDNTADNSATPSTLLGVGQAANVVDGLCCGLNSLCILVLNLHRKLILQLHHNLHLIKAVQTEITELGGRGHLGSVHAVVRLNGGQHPGGRQRPSADASSVVRPAWFG